MIKTYIYSPSLHQDLYEKIYKWFSKYLPIHIIPIILNEEDIDIEIDEICSDKNFDKPDTEIATYESIEEVKNAKEYAGGIVIPDDLNEKKWTILGYKQNLNDLGITIYQLL